MILPAASGPLLAIAIVVAIGGTGPTTAAVYVAVGAVFAQAPVQRELEALTARVAVLCVGVFTLLPVLPTGRRPGA